MALIAVAAVAPARATNGPWDDQIIQAVEYEGLRNLSPETLDFYLFGEEFEPGRRLDTADLNRRLKTLWERELVDDVAIEADKTDGGVKLTIRVVERPLLLSVDYQGLKRVNRADVNEQIDRQRISVFENQPLALGELQRLEQAIEDLYKEKGFRFAEVTYTLEEAGPGQRRAVFTIDEGNKVRIGDIDFDGNTVFGDWRLRRAMKKTKESGLISRFTKKDVYNPANIDEDLDAVRDLYRRAGYKDVLIARPEIDVGARRPDAPTLAEQKRRLLVTIPIEEGERWRLGEVRLEGNEVFGETVLLRQFDEPRGGWLRSKTIDDGVEKIDKLYKSVGYIFAQIATEIEEVGPSMADVVVKIDERDQYRVGRMEVEGNTKTRDKVLRREMFVQESSVMNMTAIQNSLLRIRQLNYFALDEDEPVRFDFDAEEKTVDLKIRGEEAERTEVQLGGGWSEVYGFFGQLAMRTTNFRGRGETLGVSFQAGQESDLYDLQYAIPWFLDRPQNVSLRLFSQDQITRVGEDFTFDRQQAGAALTYGRNLRGFQSLSFTYSFLDVDDLILQAVDPEDDTTDGEQDGMLATAASFRVSSLRPTWIYNTLDSRYEPTRGLRTTASVELAGGVLGGGSDYVRPQAALTWFVPVGRRPLRSAFGVNLEAGHIATYGGGELFSTQRFFLGGESSVRGFRNGSISVRDEDGALRYDDRGIVLGGDTMFQLNLEYHLLPRSPFRVVLFADAGGVFAGDQSLDPSLLRTSAGAELRVMVPLFPAPLRFIYARNLDPLPGDRFRSFNFSLSASF